MYTVEYPVANEVCVNNQVVIYLSLYVYQSNYKSSIYVSMYTVEYPVANVVIYLSLYIYQSNYKSSIYVCVYLVEYPVANEVCVNNQVVIYDIYLQLIS